MLNNVDEDFDFIYQFNPWLFETLRDYKYYFPHGNSYFILKKLNKIKKKLKYRKNIQKSNDNHNKSFYKIQIV